jgi:hypothetical protein
MIKDDNVLVLKINKYFLVTRFSMATMGLLNDDGKQLVYKIIDERIQYQNAMSFNFSVFCGLNP